MVLSEPLLHPLGSASSSTTQPSPLLDDAPSYPPPSYTPSSISRAQPASSSQPHAKPARPFHGRVLQPPEEDTVVPALFFSRREDNEPGYQEGYAMGPLGEGGPNRTRTRDPQGRSPMAFGGKEETVALVSLYGSLFLAGWNDSSVGPLLLDMAGQYHVSYLVLSTIFVCHSIGWSLAGAANITLTDRFGFGRVLALGSAFPVLAYALQAWAPPFPLLCFSHVLAGLGYGFQDAQANTLTARLPAMLTKISYLHAAYGAGAFISPLAATQFSRDQQWYHFYLISLGLAVLNVASVIYVFRFRTEESLLGRAPVDENSPESSYNLTSREKMVEIITCRDVQLYSAFLFLYVGLESTVGSFVVTFVSKIRNGGAFSGYLSTFFFFGLTLGRLVFIPLNRRLGEKLVTYIYTSVAIGMEVVFWLVPSLVGNAIAVFFVGLCIGPLYPLVISAMTKLLPRSLHSGALGWVGTVGQGGKAFFPFLTGILASKFGIEVVPAVIVGILGTMLVFWVFTPKVPRRSD